MRRRFTIEWVLVSVVVIALGLAAGREAVQGSKIKPSASGRIVRGIMTDRARRTSTGTSDLDPVLIATGGLLAVAASRVFRAIGRNDQGAALG